MAIQYLSYLGKSNISGVKNKSFFEVESIDNYDVTFVDFSNEDFWTCNGHAGGYLESGSRISPLKRMIENSKAPVIFLLPQNGFFYYSRSVGSYNYKKEFKTNPEIITKLLNSCLPFFNYFEAYFNKSQTTINGILFNSDFSIDNNDLTPLIYSDKSKKMVCGSHSNLFYTTLKIENTEQANAFLEYFKLGKIEDCNPAPDWIKNIDILNDAKLKNEIVTANNEIAKLKSLIESNEVTLSKNDYYKGILYLSGNELCDVVFKMIDEMIDINLNNFVDLKKEDFLFELDDFIIVGEVKGISSNVKNTNVGQVENHRQGYKERFNEEENKPNMDKVKGLLIINHQRDKSPLERNEIHQEQIDYAKRDSVLIIDSWNFLQLYCARMEDRLSKEQVIEIFKNKDNLGIFVCKGE